METVQIEGVDSTERVTKGDLKDGAQLIIKEKLMTSGTQHATTRFDVQLDGVDCSANVMSRSVAKGNSEQTFYSKIDGGRTKASTSSLLADTNSSTMGMPAACSNACT